MKKRFALILACLLAVIVVSGSFAAQPGKTTKDTLIVAFVAMPVSLDPAMTNDQHSNRAIRQIYDTLLLQDYDFNIVPGLAEEWNFENSSTLNLKLKKGVKFHNGEELKATDVKFSLERAIASPHVGHIVRTISEVLVTGEYEVQVKMKQPFAPILAHLSHTAISIVNEKAVKELGDAHGHNPVGTGPFKFDELVTGDRVELVRFDDYHGEAPLIQRLIIRSIVETSNRAIEVETGGVDIAYDILPEDIARIDDNPDTTMVRGGNVSLSYIGFNGGKAPYDDVRVRQAISYALNKNAIVQNVFKGTGAPANGPLTTKIWASAQDELEPYNYDLEKAKQLMKEAGHEGGFATTIWTDDNIQRRDIAEIVQNQLALLNITCTVEVLEWGTFLERTAAGDHDLFILGWNTAIGDPDYGLYPVFHSSGFGAAGNRGFIKNDEIDRLLDAGRAEIDPTKRASIYFDVQKLIRDEAIWVFLWQGEDLNAIRSNVRGFMNHPSGHHRLWTVYFE